MGKEVSPKVTSPNSTSMGWSLEPGEPKLRGLVRTGLVGLSKG